METITERIALIINKLELSIRGFENDISVSNGTIQKAIANNKTVGADILSKILNNYPDLSAEWLMRGEGEMLLNGNVVNNGTINNGHSNINGDITVNAQAEHKTLIEVVDFLRIEITEKNNQLKEKDNQLKEKDNFISKLLDKLK